LFLESVETISIDDCQSASAFLALASAAAEALSISAKIASILATIFSCTVSDGLGIDLYSFLKSKKMVNGIPAILCYHKGNENYIPNDMVTGADPVELHKFFKRCGNHLSKIKP
jgi:hypothetical protein